MNYQRLLQISEETDLNFGPYYNVIPDLINERGYKTGIEIGVYTGGHASAILSRTNLEMLTGVDPYQFYQNGMPEFDSDEDFEQLMRHALTRMPQDRFLLMRMNSDDAFRTIQEYNEAIFQRQSHDFVFIDGLHTYDQVKKDLENYSKIIKAGGVVAGHDIDHPTFPGVTTAIEEFAAATGKEIQRMAFHSWYINW